MSNSWVFDRQTTIYSRIKAIGTSKLKKKYPDINFTQDGRVVTSPKFPNVYIKFLQPMESGKDLEGNGINAVNLTVEIDVTVTQSMGMQVCNEVSWIIVDVLKEMCFDAQMPYFDATSTETYRTIARYSRVIGYNDVL